MVTSRHCVLQALLALGVFNGSFHCANSRLAPRMCSTFGSRPRAAFMGDARGGRRVVEPGPESSLAGGSIGKQHPDKTRVPPGTKIPGSCLEKKFRKEIYLYNTLWSFQVNKCLIPDVPPMNIQSYNPRRQSDADADRVRPKELQFPLSVDLI